MLAFADTDVQAAFPEFVVQIPYVGKGIDKVAYRAARDPDDLALKILLGPVDDDADEYDPGLVTERFRREMQGMAHVECPYIIRVVDEPQLRVIDGKNYVWYTEPFMVGGTLHGHLKVNGPLPGDDARFLAVCLLKAVDVMWNDGEFVHRDIKPKNIGYTADGIPVLLDLGVALFVQMSDITSSSLTGPGSMYYAAPEQFIPKRQATIDFRTDLFAVGIVLVEALTGAHPFRGQADYMYALSNFDPSVLQCVTMPDDLRALIPRLLASHQSRRFRTVGKALDALGEES